MNQLTKRVLHIFAAIFMVSAMARAEEVPQRISVAPGNDLAVLNAAKPPGEGFATFVCGSNLSKEYEEGFKLGSRNNHYERRHLLVIDDGKSAFPAKDKDTGLPVIILTNAKATRELQDLVRGYNAVMRHAFEQRQKKLKAQK